MFISESRLMLNQQKIQKNKIFINDTIKPFNKTIKIEGDKTVKNYLK